MSYESKEIVALKMVLLDQYLPGNIHSVFSLIGATNVVLLINYLPGEGEKNTVLLVMIAVASGLQDSTEEALEKFFIKGIYTHKSSIDSVHEFEPLVLKYEYIKSEINEAFNGKIAINLGDFMGDLVTGRMMLFFKEEGVNENYGKIDVAVARNQD